MKIREPKTKSGKIILGVTITHHPENHTNRWFINGERVFIDKIASLLRYNSAAQFKYYIKKHGVEVLLKNGSDQFSQWLKAYNGQSA